MSLLRELHDLYEPLRSDSQERHPFPAYGMVYKPIPLLIRLDSDGMCKDIVDTRSKDYKAGLPRVQAEDPKRTSGISALFLTDKLTYVAGIPTQPNHEKAELRATKSHNAYVELLDRFLEQANDPAAKNLVEIVRSFVVDKNQVQAEIFRLCSDIVPDRGDKKFKAFADLFVAFEVDGVDLFGPEAPAEIGEFWAERRRANESGAVGFCQVLGEELPLARLFPSIPVGGTSAPLVSANEDALLRYDGEQATGSRVSALAAGRSQHTLGWLLRHPSHNIRLEDNVFVWWAPDAIGIKNNVIAMIQAPDQEVINKMLGTSMWAGAKSLVVETTKFRGVVLEPRGTGRIILRSSDTATLGQVEQKLRSWFDHTSVNQHDGRRYYGIYALTAAASPPKAGGRANLAVQKKLMIDLLRNAIFGTRLPPGHLGAVLRRARLEGMSDARAVLISLLINRTINEVTMERSAAYICGALLDELNQLQFHAIGKVNRTVGEKFLGTASHSPERVLPGLVVKAEAHLGKVRKAKPGLATNIGKRMAALQNELGGFPTRLTIEEQADFVLGYWHNKHQRLNKPSTESKEETTA